MLHRPINLRVCRCDTPDENVFSHRTQNDPANRPKSYIWGALATRPPLKYVSVSDAFLWAPSRGHWRGHP